MKRTRRITTTVLSVLNKGLILIEKMDAEDAVMGQQQDGGLSGRKELP